MYITKRILSSILCAVTLITMLASCSDSGTANNETAETTAQAAETAVQTTSLDKSDVKDSLPDNLDFKGSEFRVLCRDRDWFVDELFTDDLNGDVLNDAIYERTEAVNERLNVIITAKKTGGTSTLAIANEVKAGVLAGDDFCELAVSGMYHTMPISAEGLLIDWNNVEHINLEQPWWSKYFIERSCIGGQQYFITGDLALSVYNLMFFTMFNKDMMKSYGVDNMYDIVMNGEWTIDKQGELAELVYTDINGNSTKDEADIYGFGTSDCINVDVYWNSFELPMLALDDEGYLEIALNHDKMPAAIDKILNLFYENKGTLCLKAINGDVEIDTLIAKFNADELMMTTLRLLETSKLRDMESDYGIIPIPKYEESQDGYYSFVHDQYSVFFIPATVKNTDVAGAVTEALCAENYRSVLDVYLDVVLDNKYTRDPESADMINLGLGGFKLDTGWIFAYSLDGVSAKLLRTIVAGKENTYASTYASLESTLQSNIDKLNNAFRELAK